MAIDRRSARRTLLANLNTEQRQAVSSDKRRIMVVAGAGSGKTEVMARRVAWWVAVDRIAKDQIIAFTFTEAAAEELKFRIREKLQSVLRSDEDPTLGGMFIGTIHGFCLHALRTFAPGDYYMCDVLDDAGRISLLEQGGWSVLGIAAFQEAAIGAKLATGKTVATQLFMDGYDQLNEHGLMDVELSSDPMPTDVRSEADWCHDARLRTAVGRSRVAATFAESAARYYAYLRVRRFFDFSTVQSELIRGLKTHSGFARTFRSQWTHLVVDEVQDINPVQDEIIRRIVGRSGHLTAVGDHRQAIYAFRGGRIDLMGDLNQKIKRSSQGRTIELPSNYRSTPKIIQIANEWSRTVGDHGGMANPAMKHGLRRRLDKKAQHVALVRFDERYDEAVWIADTISSMVSLKAKRGAYQDDGDRSRGLSYADIAILVRSSTDIRTYQEALRDRGVPAVVRGGPDLFSQPESLLVVSALALAANVTEFYGNDKRPGSLPYRIRSTLGSSAPPVEIVPAAAATMRRRGINIPKRRVQGLLKLVDAIGCRTATPDYGIDLADSRVACKDAADWLRRRGRLRRVFPQQIFHWILEEAGIADWGDSPMAETARFHVGQISQLVKSIETSGWTTPSSLRWQVIALLNWGAARARTDEAPLLVPPNAVSVTTIHSAKGLEFSAVFIADVCAMRFPSNMAKTPPNMPFDESAVPQIDPRRLADNDDLDNERRLMYVAITRAERYLYVSSSSKRTSRFFRELKGIFAKHGAPVVEGPLEVASSIETRRMAPGSDGHFATSFSDLRYFTECPQDFYLRIVLGYTPTIGQEFGYGRGVHNLLRAIHASPAQWAALANRPHALNQAISALVEQGMFYLRYTTGQPLANLQRKAIQGVTAYVERYVRELTSMEFQPEREFETLIPEEQLLVSGAIDVVRLDNPPRVTIIDFKSGDSDEDNGSGLSAELMELQIGVYGVAAKHELEYEPRNGLIRYIGEDNPNRAERRVDLSDKQLRQVRQRLVRHARRIRERDFNRGPSASNPSRCKGCDFQYICRLSNARNR